MAEDKHTTMQHIADYLAERAPDHEGDIVVIMKPEQRDEIVRSVNALPGLIEALEAAEEALKNCYDVADYPASGRTKQDHALAQVRSALAMAKGGEDAS